MERTGRIILELEHLLAGRDGEGLYYADCLSFPWAGGHGLILGELETAVRLGIKSKLGIVGL